MKPLETHSNATEWRVFSIFYDNTPALSLLLSRGITRTQPQVTRLTRHYICWNSSWGEFIVYLIFSEIVISRFWIFKIWSPLWGGGGRGSGWGPAHQIACAL